MTEAASKSPVAAPPSLAARPPEGRPAALHTIPPPAADDQDAKPRSEMLRNFVQFARYCYSLADEVKADAYVAHGIEALPAADLLAKAVGGRVYCDVIDAPSFRDRGPCDWHPIDHLLLEHAVDSYLRNVEGISTVSWTLGAELERYGPPVTIIPNYRLAAKLRASTELRRRCGIGPQDVLLLASSTIYSGFEPVIDALKLLPDNVHLATLGDIVADCRERVRSYPAELGIENRVHFFDEVAYDRLTAVASGANIGLVALNPAVLNHWWSVPNRVFDYIAAGLPIVTPNLPDIVRIVNQRQIGIVVASNDGYCWAEAIKAALGHEKEMRPRVRQAARELVWETLGDELRAAYGHATNVTIVSYQNLVGHQRTLRMAGTLVNGGAKVTICCTEDRQRSIGGIPGVRFVFTPNPVLARDEFPEPEELHELKEECASPGDRPPGGALEQDLGAQTENAVAFPQGKRPARKRARTR